MGSRVGLFEQIRRDHDREGCSVRELACRHGVHRRTVRQALVSALPPQRKRPERRSASKLGAFHVLIEEWLAADREVPRKQRHTARRVWQRLVAEQGVVVSERQVARYVRECRRRLGEAGEVFVPLAHDPAVEAEVDWGEAQVVLRGLRTKVFLFHMRACHSGAAFVIAFERETQQAFLEGHVEAFRWFGGCFDEIRYDNLRAAVKQVLRGRRRVESERFVALRSHYLFASQFTLAGKQGAHEKGGVEGEVGRFRRRHLVPLPQVGSLAELNELLEEACWANLERVIRGRSETVGDALERERRRLRGPIADYVCAEEASPRVDAKALVSVRQNRYSVPVGLAGLRVRAQVGAREITLWHDGRVVARHERLHGRYGCSAQLDHYLELLQRKPGALARSLPLAQARERGDWPDCFDELWRQIAQRVGRSEAARQIVDVLLLCREQPAGRIELAVQGALTAGCYDGRAVALLARQQARPATVAFDVADRLAGIGSPPPTDLSGYDRLRGQTAR